MTGYSRLIKNLFDQMEIENKLNIYECHSQYKCTLHTSVLRLLTWNHFRFARSADIMDTKQVFQLLGRSATYLQ